MANQRFPIYCITLPAERDVKGNPQASHVGCRRVAFLSSCSGDTGSNGSQGWEAGQGGADRALTRTSWELGSSSSLAPVARGAEESKC